MRYALILTFVLVLSAVAFPLQADEVGGGYCKVCTNSITLTESFIVEDDSADDSDTQSGKTSSSWNTDSNGWWSLMLELFAVEK